MGERILCAAVWYKELPLKADIKDNVRPVNCDKGVVICGYRHVHCIHTMSLITGLRSVQSECGEYTLGFLTSHNRFVDRFKAWIIADNEGQINKECSDCEPKLLSEDIY